MERFYSSYRDDLPSAQSILEKFDSLCSMCGRDQNDHNIGCPKHPEPQEKAQERYDQGYRLFQKGGSCSDMSTKQRSDPCFGLGFEMAIRKCET